MKVVSVRREGLCQNTREWGARGRGISTRGEAPRPANSYGGSWRAQRPARAARGSGHRTCGGAGSPACGEESGTAEGRLRLWQNTFDDANGQVWNPVRVPKGEPIQIHRPMPASAPCRGQAALPSTAYENLGDTRAGIGHRGGVTAGEDDGTGSTS